MEFAWGELWNKSRNRLKAGWLITAGVIAIYAGTVGPMDRFREEETQRETGLGAVAFEPASMWHQTTLALVKKVVLWRFMRPLRIGIERWH